MTIHERRVVTRAAAIAIVFILLGAYPSAKAQTSTVFEPSTKFTIPAYNGIIMFAVNGSYSNAEFENNAWYFTDLSLYGSQPVENLEVSAENSNVTVIAYRVTIVNVLSERLTYSVKGVGKQVVNMGIGPNAGESRADWVVTSNNTFLNTDWTVSPNGTVTITGLTGTVNVVYYGFTAELGNANLPFYEQHSVAIAVTVGVAVTVVAAAIVKVAGRRRAGGRVKQKMTKLLALTLKFGKMRGMQV